MVAAYSDIIGDDNTPQSEPLPNQIPNSAGGHSYKVDDWTMLDRFLILGSEGGSYYASKRELTIENAKAVERCVAADGKRVVARIVEISDAGRAYKNDPALLALAYCLKKGNAETKKLAEAALPQVARIGTHLFHLAAYVNALGGWGRSTRRAFSKWYTGKDVEKLAEQLTKYQSRDGWSHADIVRMSHTRLPQGVAKWCGAVYRGEAQGGEELPRAIQGFEIAKAAKDEKEVVRAIREYRLPRECVPTQYMTSPRVWEALLESGMGLTAMIRNLGNMTRSGLLAPFSPHVDSVCKRLVDVDEMKRKRVHPIQILSALLTYKNARGMRGGGEWYPVPKIIDALSEGFYASFGAIEKTGKRVLIGLDVSASMNAPYLCDVPGLSPRVASVALSMVTARTEENHLVMCFTDTPFVTSITPKQRLDDLCRDTDNMRFGSTDCSLPMRLALQEKWPVDVFAIYTDSETGSGFGHRSPHPAIALNKYRREMGIDAKLVVVGMVANQFSIADPNDAGMMDVVGFDTVTPSVIQGFIGG